MIERLVIHNDGKFAYFDTERKVTCSANFPLAIIRMAWDSGCDFEQEADGFGPGEGTKGDWSGIRDSSDAARATMFRSRSTGSTTNWELRDVGNSDAGDLVGRTR